MIKNFDSFTNESVREYLKPKSEEEVELVWKNLVEKEFETAFEHGKSNPNFDYLGKKWEQYSEPYHLYDNFYYYKDKIMTVYSFETGGWYQQVLEVINSTPDKLKIKIQKEIEEREGALKKLG